MKQNTCIFRGTSLTQPQLTMGLECVLGLSVVPCSWVFQQSCFFWTEIGQSCCIFFHLMHFPPVLEYFIIPFLISNKIFFIMHLNKGHRCDLVVVILVQTIWSIRSVTVFCITIIQNLFIKVPVYILGLFSVSTSSLSFILFWSTVTKNYVLINLSFLTEYMPINNANHLQKNMVSSSLDIPYHLKIHQPMHDHDYIAAGILLPNLQMRVMQSL